MFKTHGQNRLKICQNLFYKYTLPIKLSYIIAGKLNSYGSETHLREVPIYVKSRIVMHKTSDDGMVDFEC